MRLLSCILPATAPWSSGERNRSWQTGLRAGSPGRLGTVTARIALRQAGGRSGRSRPVCCRSWPVRAAAAAERAAPRNCTRSTQAIAGWLRQWLSQVGPVGIRQVAPRALIVASWIPSASARARLVTAWTPRPVHLSAHVLTRPLHRRCSGVTVFCGQAGHRLAARRDVTTARIQPPGGFRVQHPPPALRVVPRGLAVPVIDCRIRARIQECHDILCRTVPGC